MKLPKKSNGRHQAQPEAPSGTDTKMQQPSDQPQEQKSVELEEAGITLSDPQGVRDSDTSSLVQDSKPDVPLMRIVGVNAYMFASGATTSSMGLLVMPLESQRMFPHDYASKLAMWLAFCGCTQLVTPLVGYLSDRNTSKYGKRTPFLVGGALVNCTGMLFGTIASAYRSPVWYLLSLVLANTGLNCSTACTYALLPDIIPERQMGIASGVMGLLFIGGIMAGFAVIGMCFPGEDGVTYSYPFYAVLTIPTIMITVISAAEKPLTHARPILKKEILESYYMTPATHGDFFWATAMRLFYYMSLAVQSFGVFYLADIVLTCDPTLHDDDCHERAKTGQAVASMLVGFAGALVAGPSGYASDKVGRKVFVLISSLLMTLVYVIMCLSPSLEVFYLISFVYGVGNGVFMCVEYALAVDVLPNPENKARDIGIWGIASFLGTTLGPQTAGPLLQAMGDTPSHDHFLLSGYVSIFMLGSVYLAITSALLFKIKGSS